VAKVDHSFSSADRLSVHYYRDKFHNLGIWQKDNALTYDAEQRSRGDDRHRCIRPGRLRQYGAVRRLHQSSGIRATRARRLWQRGQGEPAIPRTSYVDMGLFKDIPLRERWKLQFRAEFFNVFNRVNFQQPNQSNQVDTVTSGGFGSIRAANDLRIGQLALKIIF
jgi:hypothetical protein